jgi:hypothetical protein
VLCRFPLKGKLSERRPKAADCAPPRRGKGRKSGETRRVLSDLRQLDQTPKIPFRRLRTRFGQLSVTIGQHRSNFGKISNIYQLYQYKIVCLSVKNRSLTSLLPQESIILSYFQQKRRSYFKTPSKYRPKYHIYGVIMASTAIVQRNYAITMTLPVKN